MKRKVTELEQKLINDGWCLTIKRYTGKHSEKILCYEYHKLGDFRCDKKVFDLFITLDQKRSQITDYGILNLHMERLTEDDLLVIRFVIVELRHYIKRVTEPHIVVTEEKGCTIPLEEPYDFEKREPMTPEQFDELCQEKEQGGD